MAKVETLRSVMDGAKKEIITKVSILAKTTENALTEGTSSPIEIAAALHMISKLSEAGSNIYSQEQSATTSSNPSKAKTVFKAETHKNKEKENGPKTFEELLQLKIKGLLKPDEDTITKERLLEILKGKRKNIYSKDSVDDLFLNKKSIAKEQAIGVIETILTESSKHLFLPEETFTRTKLMRTFGIHANQLNDWAMESGYDWNANPAVDRRTAIVIHGLLAFDRLTGKTIKK